MAFADIGARMLGPERGFRIDDVWQALAIAALFALLRSAFSRATPVPEAPEARRGPLEWLRRNAVFLVLWVTVGAAFALCSGVFGVATPVFRFFTLLGAAWTLIGVATSLLREPFWVDSLAAAAYLATLLFGLAVADDLVRALDGLRLTVGAFSVSAWSVVAGVAALAAALWIAVALARLVEGRIERFSRFSPSLRVLLGKIVRIGLIVAAVLVALGAIGIDLSALAVLGGAIGLGIGFGLQKVVSNFVSGIILLMDRSIKPGDVIQIDETYGWINNLRARYASVITRDGTEHLIPNEDLITQRVINWSFTNNLVRSRVPIGVAYNADPRKCIELVHEAARSVPRVLEDPPPNCLLRNFGDSALELELRFWVADPQNGIGNVRSAVLLRVWDAFKANGVQIPFPQRDLHLRSGGPPPADRGDEADA